MPMLRSWTACGSAGTSLPRVVCVNVTVATVPTREDAGDRALFGDDIATHQATDERRKELRHEAVTHEQERHDSRAALEREGDRDERHHGYHEPGEPRDLGIIGRAPHQTV
jgi:hypothetical protein